MNDHGSGNKMPEILQNYQQYHLFFKGTKLNEKKSIYSLIGRKRNVISTCINKQAIPLLQELSEALINYEHINTCKCIKTELPL